jgi:hypothetical protein
MSQLIGQFLDNDEQFHDSDVFKRMRDIRQYWHRDGKYGCNSFFCAALRSGN